MFKNNQCLPPDSPQKQLTLKITGVKFYLHTSNICKVMGSQNTYLGSFLVSHKQHGFQSETHSLITDRVLGAS